MKASLKRWLGWFISFGFLGIVLARLDWSNFGAQLREVSILELLILVLIYLAGFVLRGLRCFALLPALGIERSFKGVVVGYAANNLLPARLGEFVRAQVVGASAGIRVSVTLSSIVVERILDGFAIVIFLIIGSGGLALPDWAATVRLSGLVLFTGGLAGVLLLGVLKDHVTRLLPENRLGEIASGLVEGVGIATRDAKTVMLLLAYSFGIWFVEGMMFLYGFRVFDLPVPALGSLFVLGIVNLGVLIPSSPGNMGVFQYFTVAALAVFGVASDPATAYSFVLHLCQYVPITLMGLYYLPQFGFRSFSEIRKRTPARDGAGESNVA